MMKIFANRYFLSVKKTQLYDLHVAKKGKIVEFAGTYILILRISNASSISNRYY